MGFAEVLGGAFGLAGQGLGKVASGVESLAKGGWEEFSSNLPSLAGGGGGSSLPTLAGGGGGSGLPYLAGGKGGSGLPSLAGGGGGSGLPTIAGGAANMPDSSFNFKSGQAASDIWNPRPSSLPPKGGGTGTTVGTPGSTTASGGAYDTERDKFEMYRAYIEKYAAANGIDPDALAAMLMIETDGGAAGATAVSHAGARGLGQVMPGTWTGLADPGDDPFNPEHSIKNAAKYFAGHYKTYGSYALAAAAYLGGGGGVTNGQPTVGNYDGPGGVGGTDSRGYAAMWQEHYNGIKNRAPVNVTPVVPNLGDPLDIDNTPGSLRYGSIFGGSNPSIGQGMERTQYSTGEGASVYDYGTEFGLDGDTHTGWDVEVPRGTTFYMPAGLTGTVVKDGGTGVFRSNNGPDGPGRGELKILLSNGMELIFGHSDRIDVRKGQTITAGQLLGLTGSSDGDHMHLEVRVRDPSTRSGWRIVDPSILFGTPTKAPGH